MVHQGALISEMPSYLKDQDVPKPASIKCRVLICTEYLFTGSHAHNYI